MPGYAGQLRTAARVQKTPLFLSPGNYSIPHTLYSTRNTMRVTYTYSQSTPHTVVRDYGQFLNGDIFVVSFIYFVEPTLLLILLLLVNLRGLSGLYQLNQSKLSLRLFQSDRLRRGAKCRCAACRDLGSIWTESGSMANWYSITWLVLLRRSGRS